MLYILAYSSYWAILIPHGPSRAKGETAQTDEPTLRIEILKRLALPQILLALLTFTNFHVQIITRLSSGYPLWYIWQANLIDQTQDSGTYPQKRQIAQLILNWMVGYGLIQTALYSSFLPPA